jgi:membrane protein DedA with SNARE-associated domain
MNLSLLAALALSTLASEDLASIGAALLAREGHIPISHAVAACVTGVYLGDLALWWLGRFFGQRVLTLPAIANRLQNRGLVALGARIDTHLGAVILVSRLLPGSRLPVYLAAGIWGRRPAAFIIWSLVAVILWTPLLVVSTALFGNVVAPLLRDLESGVLASLLTAGVVLTMLKVASRLTGTVTRGFQQRFS